MGGKIFINYRRGDDSGFVQAILGRLEQAFSRDQLFIDIDGIEPGVDFVRVLEEQVAQCDVLLAVIGKDWIDARDETNARRLDNPEDFVRIEIASALSQEKRAIPVLVGDARMPRSDELPEALKPLAKRGAVRLTHERFRADTNGLIDALRKALAKIEMLSRTRSNAGNEVAQVIITRTEEPPKERSTFKVSESVEDVALKVPASDERLNVRRRRWFIVVGGVCVALLSMIWFWGDGTGRRISKLEKADSDVPPVSRSQLEKSGLGLTKEANTSVPNTVNNGPAKPEVPITNAPVRTLDASSTRPRDVNDLEKIPFGISLAQAKANFANAEQLDCWSGHFRGTALRLTQNQAGTTLFFNGVWGAGLNLIIWESSPTINTVIGVHLYDMRATVENLLGGPERFLQNPFGEIYVRWSILPVRLR